MDPGKKIKKECVRSMGVEKTEEVLSGTTTTTTPTISNDSGGWNVSCGGLGV